MSDENYRPGDRYPDRCPVCGHPAHGGMCPRERYVPPDESPGPEHVTDGRPCWCDPVIKRHDGGDVIIHRYGEEAN